MAIFQIKWLNYGRWIRPTDLKSWWKISTLTTFITAMGRFSVSSDLSLSFVHRGYNPSSICSMSYVPGCMRSPRAVAKSMPQCSRKTILHPYGDVFKSDGLENHVGIIKERGSIVRKNGIPLSHESSGVIHAIMGHVRGEEGGYLQS